MKYKKILFFIIITLFSFTCVSNPAIIDELTVFRLTILHTNDLHGRLENMPQYSTIVNQIRNEEDNVLLLDGGDLYRRGPYERFNGAVETEIFNAMRYDAIVFGNNDFPRNDTELYDLSTHTILQTAGFPVLLGNVTINGNYIEGFRPYIIKNIQGINIAIIGVTSLKPRDRGFDITKRALFDDPVQTVDRFVNETRIESDIQIVLSHAGFDVDKNMKGISAIISADTHIKLATPYIINDGENQIPIVQAGGEEDNYLGRLDLLFEKINGQWILKEFNGSLFSLDDIAEDTEIRDILDRYEELLISLIEEDMQLPYAA